MSGLLVNVAAYGVLTLVVICFVTMLVVLALEARDIRRYRRRR